jgi:pimeloyl-ACP methyl ester carboxylesterase
VSAIERHVLELRPACIEVKKCHAAAEQGGPMALIRSRDGTQIAYETTGHGPTVILVDGALAYRGYRGGRPLAAELANDFTAVTYDRRGRGESSDTQPYAVLREIEDIDTLIREAGVPAYLYGFSSGSVLAVRAAAQLGNRVAKVAVLEPPLNSDSSEDKQAFLAYAEQMAQLLKQGKNGDAVAFFLQDMLPPEVLESMKTSPDWMLMERAAPTLAYENLVMGDGAVPSEAAAVKVPALVLDGGESPEFKRAAADALAAAMPCGKRKTLRGQTTLVPPEVLAPVLKEFFSQP